MAGSDQDPKQGWFAVHSGFALFSAGFLMVLAAVLAQQGPAETTALILIGAAVMLIGGLLPRLAGTIKITPGSIELSLLERLEATRQEAAERVPERVDEAVGRAFLELLPQLQALNLIPTSGNGQQGVDLSDEDSEAAIASDLATPPVNRKAPSEESAGQRAPDRRPSSVICKQCGNHNTDTDVFCGSCGSFLEWTGEQGEPPADPSETKDAHRAEALVGGQVAFGAGINQRDLNRAQVDERDIAAVQELFAQLNAVVAAQAPDDRRDASLQRVRQLQAAVISDMYPLPTIEYVKEWFADHVPNLTSVVMSMIVHPVVGKVFAARGVMSAEFQRLVDQPVTAIPAEEAAGEPLRGAQRAEEESSREPPGHRQAPVGTAPTVRPHASPAPPSPRAAGLAERLRDVLRGETIRVRGGSAPSSLEPPETFAQRIVDQLTKDA